MKNMSLIPLVIKWAVVDFLGGPVNNSEYESLLRFRLRELIREGHVRTWTHVNFSLETTACRRIKRSKRAVKSNPTTDPSNTTTHSTIRPLHRRPFTGRRFRSTTALDSRVEGVSAVATSGPQGISRRKIPSAAAGSSPPAPQSSGIGRAQAGSRIGAHPSSYSEDLPFWQQNWFLFVLFLMAIGFFAIALLLYLGLEVPEGSPAPAAAAQEGVQITYGSVIKLMHERTKFRLHSHDVPYGSGSGQQSVTGFPNVDDSNSYWIVKPALDSSAKQGDAIPKGTIIRLQHMRTRKWLHSHLHASPISGNLEVSCFGGEGEGESDTGDLWRLEIEGSGETWRQDQRIRLRHVDTMGYLHSHDKKYSRIAGGQQEVCGVRDKRPDNVWLAAEGVYLPVNEAK